MTRARSAHEQPRRRRDGRDAHRTHPRPPGVALRRLHDHTTRPERRVHADLHALHVAWRLRDPRDPEPRRLAREHHRDVQVDAAFYRYYVAEKTDEGRGRVLGASLLVTFALSTIIVAF